MKAVILAGGLGTRLRNLTAYVPKPLIAVAGKPIVSHLVDFFLRNGISEIILLIRAEHVALYRSWQRDFGITHVRIVVEPRPMGTFGGLRLLRDDLHESFFVSNGDELKDFDLHAMSNAHRAHAVPPAATIALVQVSNPSDYGVPVLFKDSIVEFLEKPQRAPSNYINAGIFIFEPKIFDYADASKEFLMNEYDIFPTLATAGELRGHQLEAEARWYDCGTPERLEKAIKEW